MRSDLLPNRVTGIAAVIMIVKISSFVILHFCCQCFLICILFEKFFFLIHEDLKIFIKPAIRVCFGPWIS